MAFVYTFKGLFNAAAPVIRSGGHFDTLEKEVLSIQKDFSEIKDLFAVSEEERSQITGHYGLGGEFGNGIGPAIKNYLRQFEPAMVKDREQIIEENADLMQKAFNHFASTYYDKPSQRAKYASPDDEDVSSETAGPALQRALGDVQKWVIQAQNKVKDLPESDYDFALTRLNRIKGSLEKCTDAVDEIEKLAQTASISAVANNIPLRSLEREEMRALFQLNRAIGQNLHS